MPSPCIVSLDPVFLHMCAELICQVYAPPNAAKEGCQVFNEETGKATHVIQYNLYSEIGERVKCG